MIFGEDMIFGRSGNGKGVKPNSRDGFARLSRSGGADIPVCQLYRDFRIQECLPHRCEKGAKHASYGSHPCRCGPASDVHVFAEVVLAGFGVGEHLVGRAVAEHLAVADHVAAVGDLQRLADLVVGDQDGDPLVAQAGG